MTPESRCDVAPRPPPPVNGKKRGTYRGCACLRRHGYVVYLYGGARPVRGGRGRDRKEGASRAARVGLQPGSGRGQEWGAV